MKPNIESSSKPSLKKHRRIKSQQLYQPTLQPRITPPNARSSVLTFHIELSSSPLHSHKITVDQKTSMKQLKQKLCNKLDVEVGSVYFWSHDSDHNFDYRLEEEIGILNIQGGKKLGVEHVAIDQNNGFKQSADITQYFVYDCLSVGGFSKVFLVRSKKSGKFYAAKFIDKNYDKSQKFKQLILNQKYINELLDYNLLVKMHTFIETKQFYIFILDYCPAGELFCLMKNHRNMSEEDARFYFLETVLAIEYMHNKSIIYRDIKPENILLDQNGHIKIADFGLAKIMREKSRSYCGSLEYMAPEIVLGAEHSFGVDHYCLGSLLFQMMVGCPPFYNPNFTPSQTKYHIVNSTVKFPPNKNLSQQLIDLIEKLLDKNPKTRLGSLGGIKQILLHPWIGKFDRKKYQNYLIDPPFKMDLSKSNFETTYLPVQAIQEVKKKINSELQATQKISKVRSRGSAKYMSLESVERSKQKMSNTMKRCFDYSPSFKKKQKNPYQMMICKVERNDKKSIPHIQKIKYKSQCKSTHGQSFSMKFSKDRSQSKLSKPQLYSTIGDLRETILRAKGKKQNVQTIPKKKQKSPRNHKLIRKSGNFQKQNVLKHKFELKSKEIKKSNEGYLRNSLISQEELQKKMGNKKPNNQFNKILANAIH